MMNQGGRAPARTGGAGPAKRGPGGTQGVLHVLGGNDRGKQFPLAKPETQIGRGADQDVVLADIAVSRRHVVIVIEGERYRLKDLGSGNGTLINGVRTATALLNDGDQVEIGNTLLRFDHPPSAVAQAPAPAPVVPQASAQQRTMIAEAPQGYGPPASAQPSWGAPEPYAGPQETPSDAVQAPPMRGGPSPTSTMMPPGVGRPGGGGLLDTPVKKVAVMGTAALVILLGAGIIVKKTMGGGKEEAAKLFTDGKVAFKDHEYDRAKKLFLDSLKLVPEDTQTQKYAKQCDVEIHAKGAIKTAQGLAAAKKWSEELAVLDSIDKASDSYDDAEKLKKHASPEAVKAYLSEAKDALADDKDTAKQKIEAALLLDPDNTDAQELEQKLKASDTAPPAVATKDPARPKAVAVVKAPPPKAVIAKAQKTPPPPKTAPRQKTEDEEAPVAGGGGGDLLSNKAAAGPYRARDFAGAATAVRLQAKSAKGPAAQKLISQASLAAKLGDIYAKAEADKTKNPAQAVSEYQQAIAIDAQIGKSTHGAYLKGQTAKLAKDAASQSFSKGLFDVAFDMSKTATRFGGDDGGVGAKLKTKASDFSTKAGAMVRSNPNGAKAMWRTVLKMVPPSDPAYQAAQKGLSASAGAKDEDED